MRFLQQRWCLETRWCCRASRRGAAAASAVLQRRVIGGPNPPCPYETAAAGPFRAAGGTGGVHERLHQAAVRGALRSPGAEREGFQAAGGRQRRSGCRGPPQTAHGGGASAAGGATEARSAARVGRLIHRCRLRTTALKGVLWRHRSLVVTFEDIVNKSANGLGVSKSGNSVAGRKSSSLYIVS